MKLGEITVIYAVAVSKYVTNIKTFHLGSSYRPPSLKCELTLVNRRRSKTTIYKKIGRCIQSREFILRKQL